jgi:monomeric isocitrate dehydrogenase
MTEEVAAAIAIAVVNALRGIPEIDLPLDVLVDAVAKGVIAGLRSANDRLQ